MIYLKAYARGNLGDDLFIREICNWYKDKKFYLLAEKKYKKVFNDIKNLRIIHYSYKRLRNKRKNHNKWLRLNDKILKRISRRCDIFVYIGGSIFIENEQIGLRQVIELKKEISFFKKSYIIGANFGPYINKEYLNYIHDELIPKLNHISFRDFDSYNLFKDLKNVSYAPDILFSLKDIPYSINKRKEVGISLIYHLERKNLKEKYNNYLNEVLKLSINYIEKGFKIRLLSFCSYENDPLAINDFMVRVPEEYKKDIMIDYYNGNIENFLKIISGLDTIVATRFHSIVLGLKCFCKVIPICYSNKSINLLNDLDIKGYVTFDNIEKLLTLNYCSISEQKLRNLRKKSVNHFKLPDINNSN